jgi:uncharacterized protein DUF5660
MDPFSQQTTTKKKKTNLNPFAKALAEKEKHPFVGQKTQANKDDFPDTLAQSVANPNLGQDQISQDQLKAQQKEAEKKAEKKAKKERLRKKLHDQVNPVDQIDVFSAREQRVKEEIEQVRKELKALAVEISKFHKDVEVTLMTKVVNPGQEGTYYISFFQKLRTFIILLRQKIHSARTWARQMNAKKKKRHSKFGAGLDFKGNEAKATFDSMHHERYNAYSGG